MAYQSNNNKRTKRKPADPMYPMYPDAPPGSVPSGPADMFTPDPPERGVFLGSTREGSLVDAITTGGPYDRPFMGSREDPDSIFALNPLDPENQMPIPREQTEAELAEAEERVAAAENALAMATPGSEESRAANTELVRAKSAREKARTQGVMQRRTFVMDPSERQKVNNELQQNTAWVGQARYSNNEPPQIIRTPDGQMWYKQGPYVSPIKDMNEANQLIRMDSQMATVQERRSRNRIEEMELQASLESLNDERSSFMAFNRKMIGDRMSDLQARLTEEELNQLMPLYGDSSMMTKIMSMEPSIAMKTLSEMESLLLGGGSLGAANGVLSSGSKLEHARRGSVEANVLGRYDDIIQSFEDDYDQAGREIEAIDEELSTGIADEQRTQELKERRAELVASQTNAQQEINRVSGRRNMMSSEHGARHRSGDRNISRLWSVDHRKQELSSTAGPMWCIMDIVASKMGYNGIGGRDHVALSEQLQTPAGVEKFIQRCMETADSLGWESTETDIGMWVELINRHITNIADPSKIEAIMENIEVNRSSRGSEPQVSTDLTAFPDNLTPEQQRTKEGVDMMRDAGIEIKDELEFGERPTDVEDIPAYASEIMDYLKQQGVSPEDAQSVAEMVVAGSDIENAIQQVLGQSR